MKRYTERVSSKDWKVIITDQETGTEMAFAVVPLCIDAADIEADDLSGNFCWELGERLTQVLESGDVSFEDGREAIWTEARKRWYDEPLLNYDEIDEKAELEEACYEWLGIACGN